MTAIAAIFRAAADTIDPAPITAWLLLIATLIAIIGGVCCGIGFGWKWVVKPQIVLMFAEAIDARTAEHRKAHDALDQRISDETHARSAAIAHVHARIDKHIAERHP